MPKPMEENMVVPMQDGKINKDHIRALQIAAKVCKERNIQLHIDKRRVLWYNVFNQIDQGC